MSVRAKVRTLARSAAMARRMRAKAHQLLALGEILHRVKEGRVDGLGLLAHVCIESLRRFRRDMRGCALQRPTRRCMQ
jgi:hypothetical protein